MTLSRKIFLLNWLLPVPVAILSLITLGFIMSIGEGSLTASSFLAAIPFYLFAVFFGYVIMGIPAAVFAAFMWAIQRYAHLNFSSTFGRFVWVLASTLGGGVAGTVFGSVGPPFYLLLGAWTGFVVSLTTLRLLSDASPARNQVQKMAEMA